MPAGHLSGRPTRSATLSPAGGTVEHWDSGDRYEAYVGRWSRSVARDFLAWLDLPAGLDWVDVWTPFLGGQGPAPGYAMSLRDDARERLRERLRGSLPTQIDGSIRLTARAWAVRGRRL